MKNKPLTVQEAKVISLLVDTEMTGLQIAEETGVKYHIVASLGRQYRSAEKRKYVGVKARELAQRDKLRQGIKVATTKKVGRPSMGLHTLTDEQKDILKNNYQKWLDKRITGVKFARMLGLQTAVFRKVMKQYGELKQPTTEQLSLNLEPKNDVASFLDSQFAFKTKGNILVVKESIHDIAKIFEAISNVVSDADVVLTMKVLKDGENA